jgi:hypothetical protein
MWEVRSTAKRVKGSLRTLTEILHFRSEREATCHLFGGCGAARPVAPHLDFMIKSL